MPAVKAPIVVGVSPSTGSPSALRWAQQEARLRRAPLRAVMAWRAPRPPAAPAGRPPVVSTTAEGDPEAGARDKLAGFVRAALGDGVEVDCRAVRGTAVTALLAASQDAQLIVLGEPRPGRLGNLRTSLVAPQLVHRTPCPVVVLPAPEHAGPSAATRVVNAVVTAAGTAGRPGVGRRPVGAEP